MKLTGLFLADVFQKECLCGWKAHEGEVFNVQFSSDETTVYSMGRDKKFCQWSIIQSGKKVTEFQIHESACQPAVGWAQTPGGQYYPNTPRGNLFAFESEDKFVLTCSPQQALIYQVNQLFVCLLVCCLVCLFVVLFTVDARDL